jgi:hypothetical protein
MNVSGTGNFMGDEPSRDPEDWGTIPPVPAALRFYRQYALPPSYKPSCLVCGRNDYAQAGITHSDIPSVVVCLACRDRAISPLREPVPRCKCGHEKSAHVRGTKYGQPVELCMGPDCYCAMYDAARGG